MNICVYIYVCICTCIIIIINLQMHEFWALLKTNDIVVILKAVLPKLMKCNL